MGMWQKLIDLRARRTGGQPVLIALALFALVAGSVVIGHDAMSVTDASASQPAVTFGESTGAQSGHDLPAAQSIAIPDGATAAQAAAVKGSYSVGTVPAGDLSALTTLGAVVIGNAGADSIVAVPDNQLSRARALVPGVHLEPNQIMTVQDTQIAPSWGLDRSDSANGALDGKYSYANTGAGVKIYVIDTGLSVASRDFAGRVLPGKSFVNDGRGTDDCAGHGTHVTGIAAGTTYGIAKGASIVPVRVLDCNGVGYASDIISAVNWVIANHTGGPAVINVSLGGSFSASLNAALSQAVNRGFVVVAAAGNSGVDACTSSPASAAGVIAVGAMANPTSWASYSNYGPCVDINAPGSNIVSDWLNGGTATLSGTSMATPHVAGLIARVLQANPNSTAISALSYLLQGSTAPITGAPAGTPTTVAMLAANAFAPTGAPTPSVTPTPSATPTPRPVVTPSASPLPSRSEAPEPPRAPAPSPSPTRTVSPAPVPTVSPTPAAALGVLKANPVGWGTVRLTWSRSGVNLAKLGLVVKDLGSGRSERFSLPGASTSVSIGGLTKGHAFEFTVTGYYGTGQVTMATVPVVATATSR